MDLTICVAIIFWLCWIANKRSKQIGSLKKQNQLSLEEDLELATSSQLLDELRKRPAYPYVMIQPQTSEDHMGLSIEIHNMSPAMSVSILKMATIVTTKELKERGVEMSEEDSFLPPNYPDDLFNDN